MASGSLCLVDAMVLVDGVKHAFLDALLTGLAIGVAESALREVQFCRDDQGRKHPIDLTEPLDAGRLVMLKATAEELRQLLGWGVQRRLGKGELESQAMAAAGRIRPTNWFYDPRVGRWRMAREIPELAGYFPKPALSLGLLALVGLAAVAAAERESAEERLGSLPWGLRRRAVFRRDDYTCTYCGHRGTSASLEVDHRIPVSRGGSDDAENLTTACWQCNREKGDRTEAEYRRFTLLRRLLG